MRRFLYLISPNRIDENFYKSLNEALSTNKVKYFQLRLKKHSNQKLIKIGKKIKSITRKHKVKLIINDSALLAKKIDADGCHLGQSDGSINNAKKLLKNKVIGITCHGSRKLILSAIKKKNQATWHWDHFSNQN